MLWTREFPRLNDIFRIRKTMLASRVEGRKPIGNVLGFADVRHPLVAIPKHAGLLISNKTNHASRPYETALTLRNEKQ